MTLDRWREIVDQIKDNFAVESFDRQSDEDGLGKRETLIFTNPLGRLKLEFAVRPKVIDKKVTYSNRIGSEVAVDYVYSPDEVICRLLAYRWSEADDDWLPLEGQKMFS